MAILADPLCDICGRPQGDEALYALGNRRNADGDIVSIRHWVCNERDGPFAQLRDAVRGVGRG